MSLTKTSEFNEIINDIINKQEFEALKDELHHGVSRYHHCLRVAKGTYLLTKKFNLDYERATRAALLHDFFTNEDTKEYKAVTTLKIHPDVAVINAKKYFDIDKMQENVIASHMFPICKVKPKYKEAWITSCVDKAVAAYEMYRFKASLVMGVWLIFIFNLIFIQK